MLEKQRIIIMINELEKIKDSALLNNIKVDELSSMLECLKGVIKHRMYFFNLFRSTQKFTLN